MVPFSMLANLVVVLFLLLVIFFFNNLSCLSKNMFNTGIERVYCHKDVYEKFLELALPIVQGFVKSWGVRM